MGVDAFEPDVRGCVAALALAQPAAGSTVFYGSSSIRLWPDLAGSFPTRPVLNAGFGGSTLVACAWFFDRIVVPLQPARLVVYAGDNDLGDGCDLDAFAQRFTDLLTTIDYFFPAIPVTVLAIKVSPARLSLKRRILFANDLMLGRLTRRPGSRLIDTASVLLRADGTPDPACYLADGLHLAPEGYRRWTGLLHHHLDHVLG